MSIYEVHIALFDVLFEVSKILKRNDIRYYLMFGTLLGAVRENGPIKWDDDIDICVTAEEWNRMNAVLKEELDTSKFFLINSITKPNYPYNSFITRVGLKGTYRKTNCFIDESNNSGIYIDIFQLVNVPNKKIAKIIWEYNLGVIDGVINMMSLNKNAYKKTYFLSKLISRLNKQDLKKWISIRSDIQRKYGEDINCEQVTVPFGPFGVYPLKKCTYMKDGFKEVLQEKYSVENENKEIVREDFFPIPIGYKNILEVTYGKWERRPKNRRISQLSFWEN
jgi:phosphorylcholine metabolism protein LicD